MTVDFRPATVARASGVGRMAFLDSLRGLAALYVLLFHVAAMTSPALPVSTALLPLVNFGMTAPELFFIISGFSLSLTMGRHTKTGRPIFSYFCSRFFRIAPLFYIFLIFSVPRDMLLSRDVPTVSNFLLNASLLFNLFPGHQEGLVWVSWTVSVEVIYYMFFPLLNRCSLPIKIAVLIASLVLYALTLSHPWAPEPYGYFFFLGYVFLFLSGEIAFRIYEAARNRPDKQRLGLISTLIGIALLATGAWFISESEMILFRLVAGFGYCFVLLGIGLRPIAVIINTVTSFYGKISYSFYLFHILVMFAMQPVYELALRGLPRDLVYPCCVVLTVIATTIVAWLPYKLVELPGIAFGKVVFNKAALLLGSGRVGERDDRLGLPRP